MIFPYIYYFDRVYCCTHQIVSLVHPSLHDITITIIHPGQRTPLQQELMDNVKETDWYRLGLELIDEDTVNVINRDTALPRIQDKLRELFRVWLESDPTWRDIVEAERKIGNRRLARKLEEKFC